MTEVFVLVGYNTTSLGKGLQIFLEDYTLFIFKALEVSVLWDCEEENTVFFPPKRQKPIVR